MTNFTDGHSGSWSSGPYTGHDFEIALQGHHWLTQTDFDLEKR